MSFRSLFISGHVHVGHAHIRKLKAKISELLDREDEAYRIKKGNKTQKMRIFFLHIQLYSKNLCIRT